MLSDEQLRAIARNAVESGVYSGNVKALRAVEAAVRADQIEKDATIVERATRIAHNGAEARGFEQATSLLAAVIRAQPAALGVPEEAKHG